MTTPFSSDYLVWQIAYISGSVFVAFSFMEEWEVSAEPLPVFYFNPVLFFIQECLLDKASGKVYSKVESLLGRVLQLPSGLRCGEADGGRHFSI